MESVLPVWETGRIYEKNYAGETTCGCTIAYYKGRIRMKKQIMYVTPEMGMIEMKTEEVVVTSPAIDGTLPSTGFNEDASGTGNYGDASTGW